MITYENENGSIYMIETLPNATIRASIGSEKQLNLIYETETEKIYQWQRFNLKNGLYEDDTENNETATIEGREYTLKLGRVIVHKVTQESMFASLGKQLAETKLENMKLNQFVSSLAKESARTKIEIMNIKKEAK